MAKVLYAWEFGAALGHIGTFLPVARALRQGGHQVHWAVTQPDQAARLLDAEGFEWLQAPTTAERSGDGPPLNYADILLRYGYADERDLLGLVVAWRGLLRLTGAQVVLTDHAPTAVLAARTLGVPVMQFGGGFFTPPPLAPLPALRPWLGTTEATLAAIDARALLAINAVLGRFERSPLERVADLFVVAETALLTFPELDHYRQRGPATYWGALPAAVSAPPQWPQAEGPRVFAYLRPHLPHVDACLRALAASPCVALVYAPGLGEAERAAYATPRMRFAEGPVDLNQTAREAVAGINYAAAATTIAFLLAGKPVLLLPGHIEQYMFAQRVVELGAGLALASDRPPLELPALLARIVAEPGLRQRAEAFARKYSGFPQEAVIRNIVRRVEELAAAPEGDHP